MFYGSLIYNSALCHKFTKPSGSWALRLFALGKREWFEENAFLPLLTECASRSRYPSEYLKCYPSQKSYQHYLSSILFSHHSHYNCLRRMKVWQKLKTNTNSALSYKCIDNLQRYSNYSLSVYLFIVGKIYADWKNTNENKTELK